MKTFQQFVREYTQAELDKESKNINTQKPLGRERELTDMKGNRAVPIPGQGALGYLGRGLVRTAAYSLRGTNPITKPSVPTPGGKRPN